MENFINLRLGGMNVQEFSLKFTKFYKYAYSLVPNSRYEMTHFMTGLTDELEEECHVAMIHGNMDISCLMVHAQHVDKRGSTGRIESLRGQSPMMVILLRVSLRFKINKGTRRVVQPIPF